MWVYKRISAPRQVKPAREEFDGAGSAVWTWMRKMTVCGIAIPV